MIIIGVYFMLVKPSSIYLHFACKLSIKLHITNANITNLSTKQSQFAGIGTNSKVV